MRARGRGADLLERMRANPQDDWQIADVERLCRAYGLRCTPPRGGGDHWKVRHPAGGPVLTIPAARPIKPVYIRRLVAVVEEGKG